MSKKIPENSIFSLKWIWKEVFAGFYKAPPGYFAKITVIDRILEKTVLKLVPGFVTPNHITIFRYATIPFVAYFLWYDKILIGGLLFSFSAFTDALDGALARK